MAILSDARVEGKPTPFPDVPMATLNVLPNGAMILCRWRAVDEDWIVLCYWPHTSDHYVTWHTDDRGRADWGYYFQTYRLALADFCRRVDRMQGRADA